MSDRAPIISSTVILGGALSVLCCASPFLLAGVLGAGGLATVLASGAGVLTLALVATTALVGLLLYRDRYRHLPSGRVRSAAAEGARPEVMNDYCTPLGAENGELLR